MIRMVAALVLVAGLARLDGLDRASSPKGPDNADIARKMVEAIQSFKAIEVTGTVRNYDLSGGSGGSILGGLEPITFRTLMSPDQLRCDAYRDGKHLASYAWHSGRFQEYRPHLPHRPLMEYDGQLSCGSDDTILKEDYDCLLWCQMTSWLHLQNPVEGKVEFWTRIVHEGKRLPDELVDGIPCTVFEMTRGDGAEVVVRNRLFLNTETLLPVATFTFAWDVRRENHYQIKAIAEPIASDSWRIRISATGGIIPANGRGSIDLPEVFTPSQHE